MPPFTRHAAFPVHLSRGKIRERLRTQAPERTLNGIESVSPTSDLAHTLLTEGVKLSFLQKVVQKSVRMTKFPDIECWNLAAAFGRWPVMLVSSLSLATRFESRIARWVASHIAPSVDDFGFAYSKVLDKHRFQLNERAEIGAARYFLGTSSTLNGTP